MIKGNFPIIWCTASASSIVVAVPEVGVLSPMSFMASLKSSRSSALSIEGSLAPMSSTPYLFFFLFFFLRRRRNEKSELGSFSASSFALLGRKGNADAGEEHHGAKKRSKMTRKRRRKRGKKS